MRAVSRTYLAACFGASACLLLCSHVDAQVVTPTRTLTLTEDQAIMRFMEQSPDVRALRHRVAEQAQQNRARTLLTNPMLWYTQENAAGVRDDFLQFRQPSVAHSVATDGVAP